MPALVNSSVGSLPGTSGLEGTMVWPRAAKKSRKSLRISALLFMAVGSAEEGRRNDGGSAASQHAGGRRSNQSNPQPPRLPNRGAAAPHSKSSAPSGRAFRAAKADF